MAANGDTNLSIVLKKAIDLYLDMIPTVKENDPHPVTEKNLEESHKSTFEKVVVFFQKKITDDPSDSELKQLALVQLKNELDIRYKKVLDLNRKCHANIQAKDVALIENIVEGINEEINNLELDNTRQQEKLVEVRQYFLQLAGDQFKDASGTTDYPEVFNNLSSQLQRQVSDAVEGYFQILEDKLKKEEAEEMEIIENNLQSFHQKVKHQMSLHESPAEPTFLAKLLQTERQEAIQEFESNLPPQRNLIATSKFNLKLDEEIRAILGSNEEVLNRMQEQLKLNLDAVMNCYKKETEFQLEKTMIWKEGPFKKIHEKVKEDCLEQFQIYSNQHKLPTYLVNQGKQDVVNGIERSGNVKWCQLKELAEQYQKEQVAQAERKYLKEFENQSRGFIQMYDIMAGGDFQEMIDDAINIIMSFLMSQLELDRTDEELAAAISTAVRVKVELRKEKLWEEQEKRNTNSRTSINDKMYHLMKQFEEKFRDPASRTAHRLHEERDNCISQFSKCFTCSSSTDSQSLIDKFKRDIQKSLTQLQASGPYSVTPNNSPKSSGVLGGASGSKSSSSIQKMVDDSLMRGVRNLPAVANKDQNRLADTSPTTPSWNPEPLRDSNNEKKEKKLAKGTIVEAACGYYREAMMRHFSRPIYLNPNRLAGLHHNCAKEALNKLSKRSLEVVSKDEIYRQGFDKEFEIFENRNNMNAPTSYAIGIDLGTTYSCATVYIDGKIEVIPNEQGKLITPSYVSFSDPNGKAIVGDEAKTQAGHFPEKTVYEVKRLIGRSFDKIEKEDLEKWPFKIVEERGIPKVMIDWKTYHPEEISAEILKEMKRIAEVYLKNKVQSCVITVPAYFDNGQREATKAAGQAAGMEVLRIINEPTAAAIAASRMNWNQDLGRKNGGPRTGLVFDMGGGTFDVCLYRSCREEVEVLKVGGDTHLGGVDFDNEILNFCVEEFERQHGVDLLDGRESSNLLVKSAVSRKLMRLKGAAEQCKKQLTDAEETIIRVDGIYKDLDLIVKLSRSKFVEFISPYLKKALDCVEKVLREKELGKDEIDEILMVGGSTKIPELRRILKEYFGKELNTQVDPDLSVGIGAGFEAAVLNGKRALERGDLRTAAIAPEGMSIKDVMPLSFGIAVNRGRDFYPLIPKQSRVPIECVKTFATTINNQTSVQIVVYEGEEPLAKDNHEVGKFYLNGIPSGPAKAHSIQVKMRVSEEGIIYITATCIQNGVQRELQVRDYKKRLTKEDIARLQEIHGVGRPAIQIPPAASGSPKMNFIENPRTDDRGSAKTPVTSHEPTTGPNSRLGAPLKQDVPSPSPKFPDPIIRPTPERKCRFCKEIVKDCKSLPVALGGDGIVCADPDCQEYAKMACKKMLPCDHVCGGVKGEVECLTCLRGCLSKDNLRQNLENDCVICLNPLATAPAIQIDCGHVFHYHCTISLLENRWMGPRITFSFSQCPACKADIDHPLLEAILKPIKELLQDVQEKSLRRLRFEGLENCPEIIDPESQFHNNPIGFAIKRYSYYVCFKCNKAYFGGEAVCGDGADFDLEAFNPAELVCGPCSDVAGIQNCDKPEHGVDYIEFKCRFCCSPAIFFCLGSTHFCNICHNNSGRMCSMPAQQLPSCPAGPNGVQLNGECPLKMNHPPTGQEFPLGCGLCRHLNSVNF